MYFEDFSPGDVFVTAPVVMKASEIIEFATQFDPQPFHLDPEQAAQSIYGGLIASGWHVFSRMFGQVVRLGLFQDGGQGSPGLEEAQWRKPVRPDDTLRARVTVEWVRPSASRSDRGYAMFLFEVLNQRDEVVALMRAREIFLRRPA